MFHKPATEHPVTFASVIINSTRRAPNRDIATFAWSGLRRFLNETLVSEMIETLHKTDKKQRSNVRKQARHIRYCLMQAREYADAAERASLVTKPTLLYYSAMCLALAETLFKQGGLSSLDAARQQHSHHGLVFKLGSNVAAKGNLADAAEILRAGPALASSGRRHGTFELWHQSARDLPVVGEWTIRHKVGTTRGPRVLVDVSDDRLAELPHNGVTLLDALKRLPALREDLDAALIEPEFVRATVVRQMSTDEPTKIEGQIIVHPCTSSLLDRFLELCLYDGPVRPFLKFVPVGTAGGNILFSFNESEAPKFAMPSACMLSENDGYFWLDKKSPLNEFGWYYVALFITGNYARYYPDQWIVDVEKNTPLALAIEVMLRTAADRVPLLTLSELSRSYVIPQEWH